MTTAELTEDEYQRIMLLVRVLLATKLYTREQAFKIALDSLLPLD